MMVYLIIPCEGRVPLSGIKAAREQLVERFDVRRAFVSIMRRSRSIPGSSISAVEPDGDPAAQ